MSQIESVRDERKPAAIYSSLVVVYHAQWSDTFCSYICLDCVQVYSGLLLSTPYKTVVTVADTSKIESWVERNIGENLDKASKWLVQKLLGRLRSNRRRPYDTESGGSREELSRMEYPVQDSEGEVD